MENVVLIILLLLALALIGAVLLQRSEGGGLGMGGGGGAQSGRSPGTPLGKLTWILGGAFMATSLALTIIAANNSAGVSVLDRLTDAPITSGSSSGLGDDTGSLLPPTGDENATPTAE